VADVKSLLHSVFVIFIQFWWSFFADVWGFVRSCALSFLVFARPDSVLSHLTLLPLL